MGKLPRRYKLRNRGYFGDAGSNERDDIKKEDAAKARGWLKKLTSFKFLLHVYLYLDILKELTKLSLLFQKDQVSIPDAIDGITTSVEVLKDLSSVDLESAD